MKRKHFIRISGLASIAMLLPIQHINALKIITKQSLDISDPTSHEQAIALAALAKKAFYKKQYNKAETSYLECIRLAPADIRFYDNLQNVYASQNKILLATQLFKIGLEANPTKIAFYDRLAKTLMQLAIGNQKIGKAYNNTLDSSSLLSDAEQLYLQAIAIDSEKAYLTIGLEKVRYKQSINAATSNANSNVVLKAIKKANRAQNKIRYEYSTNQEVFDKITSIDSRKRNTLYLEKDIEQREQSIIREKKTLYTLLLRRQIADKNYPLAIYYANKSYELDPTDSGSIQSLKQLYIKTKQFTILVKLLKDYDAIKNTAWSKLGIIHAIWLGYKHDASDININEAITLSTNLLSDTLITKVQRVNIAIQLNKIYLKQGRFQDSERLILDLITNQNIKNKKNRIMLADSYVSIFIRSNRLEEAKGMLKVALQQQEPDKIGRASCRERV